MDASDLNPVRKTETKSTIRERNAKRVKKRESDFRMFLMFQGTVCGFSCLLFSHFFGMLNGVVVTIGLAILTSTLQLYGKNYQDSLRASSTKLLKMKKEDPVGFEASGYTIEMDEDDITEDEEDGIADESVDTVFMSPDQYAVVRKLWLKVKHGSAGAIRIQHLWPLIEECRTQLRFNSQVLPTSRRKFLKYVLDNWQVHVNQNAPVETNEEDGENTQNRRSSGHSDVILNIWVTWADFIDTFNIFAEDQDLLRVFYKLDKDHTHRLPIEAFLEVAAHCQLNINNPENFVEGSDRFNYLKWMKSRRPFFDV